jgi:sec-independent protein translocase protein TatA
MLAMIGAPEGLLILGAVLLLFGARRLPDLARSLGEGIREFRKSTRALAEDEETASDKPISKTKES